MNIKRILISQPAPATEKSPYSELISKHDVVVDFRPFIAVEGVSLKEFRKQRVEILDHTAVILTSRGAVDHFFRICEECRITVPESMKYFCVTEAIALYLQKYIVYRKRKIFFGEGTFFALMDIVVKHKEERYLVPLNDPHKPEIPLTLTKIGVKFSKVVLSHTVSADLSDLDLGVYDVVALYSPSDVNSLLHNFGGAGVDTSEPTGVAKGVAKGVTKGVAKGAANASSASDTGTAIAAGYKMAVFGRSTAARALEVGLKVDIMTPTPQLPSLATALDRYITAFRAGKSTEEFALVGGLEPSQEYSKGVVRGGRSTSVSVATTGATTPSNLTAATTGTVADGKQVRVK